ncbi:uncharacterized protein [Ptychodera flava]|uniref:uncharacterized protein n=1 Tax=Ptychodera flava TaxID=63121 RepID=UPI003969CC1D
MPNMKAVTTLTLFILVTISEHLAVETHQPIRDLEDELLDLVENEIFGENVGDDIVFVGEDEVNDMKPHDHGGVPMGDPSFDQYHCDDGYTNLEIDWDGNVEEFECLEKDYWSSQRYDGTDLNVKAEHFKEMPATHVCMDSRIVYEDRVPTSGAHRPLWPVFGEYTYLPPQRWVHSLEHGSIVALYHPCTDPAEVETLRSVVTGCLRKHIISPYKQLTKDLPIALVSWTWRLYLPYADETEIKKFIQEHALHAPEAARMDDGQFSEFLENKAAVVSDGQDSVLCPEE